MDRAKYNHIVGANPNIVFRQPKDDTQTHEYIISSPLAALARRIALRKPRWTIEYLTQRRSTGLPYIVSSFVVWEKGEELGTVTRDVRNYKEGCRIYNKRISNDLYRKKDVFTSDLNKAIKIIEKYFFPPSVNERLAFIANEVQSIGHRHASICRQKHQDTERLMQQELLVLLKENWNGLMDEIHNRAPLKQESYINARQAAKEAEGFYGSKNAGVGHYVLQSDAEYAIYKTGCLEPTQVGLMDILPEHIKMALGLLKMVETETVIPEVGLRIDESAFFILNPKEVA